MSSKYEPSVRCSIALDHGLDVGHSTAADVQKKCLQQAEVDAVVIERLPAAAARQKAGCRNLLRGDSGSVQRIGERLESRGEATRGQGRSIGFDRSFEFTGRYDRPVNVMECMTPELMSIADQRGQIVHRRDRTRRAVRIEELKRDEVRSSQPMVPQDSSACRQRGSWKVIERKRHVRDTVRQPGLMPCEMFDGKPAPPIGCASDHRAPTRPRTNARRRFIWSRP